MSAAQSIYNEGQELNEADFWTEFKSGNRSAYAHIYQSNVQALFDYGMHVHADNDLVKDCIQELYINIWQRRKNLGNVKNIRAYLMRGLRRRIIDALNAEKGMNSLKLDILREKATFNLSYGINSDEASIQREKGLLEAIEKLPPRQKEIVYLVFYKSLPNEEIARIMSINGASVYTLTWKAIKTLKKQLKYIPIFLLPFLYF